MSNSDSQPSRVDKCVKAVHEIQILAGHIGQHFEVDPERLRWNGFSEGEIATIVARCGSGGSSGGSGNLI